jgi:hypothetical protein
MTFHIRVVTAPGATEELVARLVAEPGVSNVVVLAGSARQPEGDAVQFDVPARSANAVLQQIRAIRDGPIAIASVDAVIGEEPDRTARFGVVQRDIAPVWDVVEARIRANAVYPPSFYTLLAIAGLIGAVGILINSQILIVGAMVVGPEYNAIMGIALGLSLAYTTWHAALGSTAQLLLNVAVLILVGAAVMRLQRIIWRSRPRAAR